MTFANWLILNFLFVPAGILVWVWRFRGGRVALPWDHGRQRSGRFWGFSIRLFQSIPALLLAVAIILWAGPQSYSVPKAKRELTNIEFCLDLSGSMTAPFGKGTRYDAAMEAINEFIQYREGDAFGLTIFGDTANQWIPLTSDTSAFKCATPFLRPERMPRGYGGGTMIGLALRKSLDVLNEREQGDRMIVLVSDGVSFDLQNGQDEEVAKELREQGVIMYGVHIGDGNVPSEVAAIATITGGSTFSPGNEQALAGVFRRIDSMQVAKLERTYAELLDFFWPFSIGGVALLGLFGLSLFGLRFTPW